MIRQLLFGFVVCLAVGCSNSDSQETADYRVQWVDKRGNTWYAPPVTPDPNDPVYDEHPEAGVVVIDRATRKKRVLKDPTAFLKEQQSRGGPSRFLFVQELRE